MSSSVFASAALAAALAISSIGSASAEVIVVTQQKALAGNLAPDDAPGFPVTLSRPGSYRLAGNLSIPPNKTGILVAAQHVSLDLNGFQIEGGGKAEFGVRGKAPGATIRNGTVSGFKQDGINGEGEFWMIKDVRVLDNGGSGIACADICLIERSMVASNGGAGIDIGSGIVLASTIAENATLGIEGTGDGVGLADNMFAFNAGAERDQFGGSAAAMEPNLCVSDEGIEADC